MALELMFIELLIVEAAKLRGQPAEGPDKSELRGDDINDETEPSVFRKREALLGFRLHLGKGISHRQKVRNQLVAAISRKCKVADPVGGIEGAAYQLAAFQGMLRPWHDKISEGHIGSGPITLQAPFFDQFIAESAESKSVLVVAEARSGYDG